MQVSARCRCPRAESGRWKLAALPAADDPNFDAQLMRVIARANGAVGRDLAAAGSHCFLQQLEASQVPDLPCMFDSGRTAIASVYTALAPCSLHVVAIGCGSQC
jgi:hypothetical protein